MHPASSRLGPCRWSRAPRRHPRHPLVAAALGHDPARRRRRDCRRELADIRDGIGAPCPGLRGSAPLVAGLVAFLPTSVDRGRARVTCRRPARPGVSSGALTLVAGCRHPQALMRAAVMIMVPLYVGLPLGAIAWVHSCATDRQPRRGCSRSSHQRLGAVLTGPRVRPKQAGAAGQPGEDGRRGASAGSSWPRSSGAGWTLLWLPACRRAGALALALALCAGRHPRRPVRVAAQTQRRRQRQLQPDPRPRRRARPDRRHLFAAPVYFSSSGTSRDSRRHSGCHRIDR